MSFDLANFGLQDWLACSVGLARVTRRETTLAKAATATAQYFYEGAVDGASGQRVCVAVSCYRTRARHNGGAGRDSEIARLAFVGDPAFEQALARLDPIETRRLNDPEFARRRPILAHLCHELGLAVGAMSSFAPPARAAEHRTYGVLHARDVAASPYTVGVESILASHGVQSVLALGSVLFGGDVVAVILDARIVIPDESAEQFRRVALDLAALLRSHEGPGFAA